MRKGGVYTTHPLLQFYFFYPGWDGVRDMVFNEAFNISVISWLSVLLVEETGVPGENHRPAANQ